MNQIIPFPRATQSDALNASLYSLERAVEAADFLRVLVERGVPAPPAKVAELRQAMHDAKSAFERANWPRLLPSSAEFRHDVEARAAAIVQSNQAPDADEAVEILDLIIAKPKPSIND